MARLNVNPTRMVLTNLKKRLKTARRGHKLLKDKRDELMKKFLAIVKENRKERQVVEKMMTDVYSRFIMARALMSDTHLEEALIFPKQKITLKATSKNVMSVEVPVFEFSTEGQTGDDIFPYGFATTSGELDGAM
ncbi:MAG: V-type ATP synthase subunit D, partial [Clostridiales bacterium]|nr:V-type ATP synthase subunit D [Clostridiales bacterium]